MSEQEDNEQLPTVSDLVGATRLTGAALCAEILRVVRESAERTAEEMERTRAILDALVAKYAEIFRKERDDAE